LRRRGGADFATASFRGGQPSARESYVQDGDDRTLSLEHLKRAVQASDFEADVWRQRALDMETANEREREQAKRLMEFELSAALQGAEAERSRLMSDIRQRDLVVAKLELDLEALCGERDSQERALSEARRQTHDHQYHHKQFEELMTARNLELEAMSKELHNSRCDAQVGRRQTEQLEVEVSKLRHDGEERLRLVQNFQAEAQRLTETVAEHNALLSETRQERDRVVVQGQAQRAQLQRLELNLQELQAEQSTKAQTCTAALRRAELLNAKCEGLEAALESANSKQADMAVDREQTRERIAVLEESNSRLRRCLEDARIPSLQDTGAKFAGSGSSFAHVSTASAGFSPGSPTGSSGKFLGSSGFSTTGSFPSSPRFGPKTTPVHPLPPLVPPSASQPKERRGLTPLPPFGCPPVNSPSLRAVTPDFHG